MWVGRVGGWLAGRVGGGGNGGGSWESGSHGAARRDAGNKQGNMDYSGCCKIDRLRNNNRHDIGSDQHGLCLVLLSVAT